MDNAVFSGMAIRMAIHAGTTPRTVAAHGTGCLWQKLWEKMRDVTPRYLFSLGSHSKQVGDEGGLPADVSFFYIVYLSLPHHIHHLIPS